MESVRLIGITTPRVEGVETPEQLLAYCARVSSTQNQLKHETGPKLIRSLVLRQEWSPLEMLSLTMEINTTRDIGRQILRHRSFSFQEFSQRYAVVNTSNLRTREARMQNSIDRQISTSTDDEELKDDWDGIQEEVKVVTSRAYKWAIENGIAKEQARAVLPEGLTPTQMYMAGTLRSWVHYCQLRTKVHTKIVDNKEVRYYSTQQEHVDIAKAAWNIIETEIPSMKNVVEIGQL